MGRETFGVLALFAAAVSGLCHGLAFTSQGRTSSFGRRHVKPRPVSIMASPMTMRDRSSANWFQVGDAVRVVDDVPKAGFNLNGRKGIVVQTWEKCDVDPTCCCAEQVDLGMAVHVRFSGTAEDDSVDDTFIHYFAEDELDKIKDPDGTSTSTAKENSDGAPVAFDGLSCTEFKLQQLQVGEQAQRIAAFEAKNSKSD